jgi:hypothetical protein
MGRKCHWVESGPVGSAQLAQWTEVHRSSLDLTPEAKQARWALVGPGWAGAQFKAHIARVRSIAQGKRRPLLGLQARGAHPRRRVFRRRHG